MSLFLPHNVFENIYEIPDTYWSEHHIKAVLFDIDNTLAPYHTKAPDEKAAAYVRKLMGLGMKVCIISNNKEDRVRFFCEGMTVPFVFKAQKPAKKGFRDALSRLDVKPEHAVIIGDQIFTDIVGGRRAGMQTILVMPFDHRENLFIKLKRFLEKPFIRAYHRKNKKSL